jgi:hypothetical protein
MPDRLNTLRRFALSAVALLGIAVGNWLLDLRPLRGHTTAVSSRGVA